MGKVIDMFTRREVTELPVTKEDGEAVIEAIINFELSRSIAPFSGPVELINSLILMVENSSGASRYDVMNKIYERKMS